MNLVIENKNERIEVQFKWDVSKLTSYQLYERVLLCMKVSEREKREEALKEYAEGVEFMNFGFSYDIFQSNELFSMVVDKQKFISHCIDIFRHPDGEIEDSPNSTWYGRMCSDMVGMLSIEQRSIVIDRLLAVDFYDFHSSDIDIINNTYFPISILESMTEEQLNILCSKVIYPIHNDVVYTATMSYVVDGGMRKYFLTTIKNG